MTAVGASADGTLFACGTLGGQVRVHAMQGRTGIDAAQTTADDHEASMSYSRDEGNDDDDDAPVRLVAALTLDASPVVCTAFSAEGASVCGAGRVRRRVCLTVSFGFVFHTVSVVRYQGESLAHVRLLGSRDAHVSRTRHARIVLVVVVVVVLVVVGTRPASCH